MYHTTDTYPICRITPVTNTKPSHLRRAPPPTARRWLLHHMEAIAAAVAAAAAAAASSGSSKAQKQQQGVEAAARAAAAAAAAAAAQRRQQQQHSGGGSGSSNGSSDDSTSPAILRTCRNHARSRRSLVSLSFHDANKKTNQHYIKPVPKIRSHNRWFLFSPIYFWILKNLKNNRQK